ncbi:MAG: phospho-sugar mutase, partial [Acidimicrobiales bacterium]
GGGAGVLVPAPNTPARDTCYFFAGGAGALLVPPAARLLAGGAAAATPGAVLAGIPLAATPSPAGRAAIPLAPSSSPLVARLDDGVVDAYMDAVARLAPDRSARRVSIVYTAMHGVGAETLLRLFERAGFPPPHLVTEQAEPDPDFPTLAFPNPEEPGALDLALAEARRVGADLVIANDPDADRLAVAVPDASPTGWRALTGDELGVLLADHVLASGEGDDRLVATTVVSSSMLEHLARAAGVHHARTLTGFKWIVRAAERRPGTRFVYGYEEALGYAVGDVVRDKDGLSAALVVAELAALERRRGRTLGDRIEALSRRFGLHATAQWSARLDGPGARAAMAGAMAGLRASPPASIGDRSVTAVEDLSEGRGDLPPADVLTFRLDGGARVVVRPSGTEPKLKAYLEVVLPVAAGRPVGEVRAEAARQLGELRAGLGRVTGLL